jgi:hypothetical protein
MLCSCLLFMAKARRNPRHVAARPGYPADEFDAGRLKGNSLKPHAKPVSYRFLLGALADAVGPSDFAQFWIPSQTRVVYDQFRRPSCIGRGGGTDAGFCGGGTDSGFFEGVDYAMARTIGIGNPPRFGDLASRLQQVRNR